MCHILHVLMHVILHNYQFSLGERQGTFGSALTVELPTIEKAGTTFKLRVDYSTTDKCTAIQFLEPSQTEGKQVNIAGF